MASQSDPQADAPRSVKEQIRRQAYALGFSACGFTRAETSPQTQRHLADFIAADRHREMTWMADTQARRADPKVLWPEARSVIMVGMNYANHPNQKPPPKDRAQISAYGQRPDYHKTLKKRLKRLARMLVESHPCQVKVFVDTAPVMEKPLAQAAGLGWQGKHTNLVSRRFGSWLLLGEIFTDLELAPDKSEADHCGSCDACRQACPTEALSVPYQMDTELCLAYQTVEAKSPMPEALQSRLGNRLFGCDDCLQVCPWNKFATPASEPKLQAHAELMAPRLCDLAALDANGFAQFFAGTPVKRVGAERFFRTLRIALANISDGEASD